MSGAIKHTNKHIWKNKTNTKFNAPRGVHCRVFMARRERGGRLPPSKSIHTWTMDTSKSIHPAYPTATRQITKV